MYTNCTALRCSCMQALYGAANYCVNSHGEAIFIAIAASKLSAT